VTQNQDAGRGAVARPVSALRDVARAAGVSLSTASRVLSGSSHPVSSLTRARVLEAAEVLGFQPNRVARALATARSQTIGVMVHDISDPYYGEVVRGLEDAAEQRGYALFVASADRDPARELTLVKAFIAHRVDALVFVASGLSDPSHAEEMNATLAGFEAQGGVVVALSDHHYPAPRVWFDHRATTRELVEYLIGLGHRSIGHLAGPPDLVVSRTRQRGYEDALEGAGIELDPALVEPGGFSLEGGAQATRSIFTRRRPTAVVAANDLMAIGGLREVIDMGLRVPDDVSLAGVDDIEFAAYALVPLTTVRMPLPDLGRLGTELVLQLLDGDRPETPPSISSELVVRASTGPAPDRPPR
jgi:LacI family transcriptional regulator